MERSAPEYSQSGLPSPYPSNFGDSNSEESTADHASAAQYPVKQEVNYSTSATPTSEYGVYPQSARSGSFPDQIQRSYHPATTSGSGGGMAQQQNSPSLPQHDGRAHHANSVKSDNDVPIDPSIAAPSPTYAYPPQHSPYGANPDMTHSYSHPPAGMYTQTRPDWAGYGQHGAAPLTPGHPVYTPSPASAPPQQRPNQVRKSEGGEGIMFSHVRSLGELPERRCGPQNRCQQTEVDELGLTFSVQGIFFRPNSRSSAAQTSTTTIRGN